MTTVQLDSFSAIQSNTYTGPVGEITADTTNWAIRLHDGSTAGGHSILPLPSQSGNTGDFLTTNGTSLSWAPIIPTSPGGGNQQIQYNSAGVFGGVPNFSYDGTTLLFAGGPVLWQGGYGFGGVQTTVDLSNGSSPYWIFQDTTGNGYLQLNCFIQDSTAATGINGQFLSIGSNGLPVWQVPSIASVSGNLLSVEDDTLYVRSPGGSQQSGPYHYKSPVNITSILNIPTRAAFNGTTWVLVGSDSHSLTSPDSITWTQRTMPVNALWNDIVWNGSIFCAVAINNSQYAATSPDGITWTLQTLPPPGGLTWANIAWNGSVFCSLATSHGNFPSTLAATSPDGITWTTRTIVSGSWCDRLIWNGSVFCTVDEKSDHAATSPDGITWTLQTISGGPGGGWNDIAWNGSVFCTVNNTYSEAATSPDGITWTIQPLPGTFGWSSVSASGNNFCVISAIGNILISADNGVSWTYLPTIPVNGNWLHLSANDEYFLAIGGNGFTLQIQQGGPPDVGTAPATDNSTLAASTAFVNTFVAQTYPASTYEVTVQVTGFTYTIPNGILTEIFNPAGPLATGTGTMAALPTDGQRVVITTSQTIASFTLNGNVGQTILDPPTTLVAGTSVEFFWNASSSTWFRLR